MPENAHDLSPSRNPARDHEIGPKDNALPADLAPVGLASRTVQPEMLDRLPPASPAALASRRDLRVINHLMGNQNWFSTALRQRHRAGETVLEIGAGTGELGCALHGIAPGLAGLDLGPRPARWPRAAPWFETNVLTFTGWNNFPVVIANLFFHHFDRDELAKLGAQFTTHTRVIIAVDPFRDRRSQALFSLLCPLIRAHPVTRHDGRVSIAAGFRDEELPQLLQLEPALWSWRVQTTWRGAARFVAMKRP